MKKNTKISGNVNKECCCKNLSVNNSGTSRKVCNNVTGLGPWKPDPADSNCQFRWVFCDDQPYGIQRLCYSWWSGYTVSWL